MKYNLESTDKFDKWFKNLRDKPTKRRVLSRLARIENGNFGDYKDLKAGLSELKFKFGAGLRIYYTLRGECIVLLLAGGDKSSQRLDIPAARRVLQELE